MDTLSDAISTNVSTEASYRQTISGDLEQALADETQARNTQYTSISESLSADVTTLSDAISDAVSDLTNDANVLSDAISDATADLTTALDQEITDRETAVTSLSESLSTDYSELSDALSIESSSRLAAVEGLSTEIYTLESDFVQDISAVSVLLNYTISNEDPAVIDSISELLTSYQDADTSLTGAINSLITTELRNNKAHDERLDYLERFCVMISDFLHMVHVDEVTSDATLVAFPPTNDDSAIYNDTNVAHESNIYVNYQSDASYDGFLEISAIQNPGL
jgi:hypothetical protein